MNISGKLQRYLDGEMSQEEIIQFRKELKRDPELMEELKLHELIDENLSKREEAAFREKVGEAYKKYIEKEEVRLPGNKKTPRSIIIYSTALAAALVIALFVLLPKRQMDADEIFSSWYETMEFSYSSRNSGESSVPEILQQGLVCYRNKDYSQAILILEKHIDSDDSHQWLSRFYLAMSFIETGKFDKAEIILEKVSSGEFSYLQEHARWYLGLVYLKNDQIEKAKAVFHDISSNHSFYTSRSKEILQKIEAITN